MNNDYIDNDEITLLSRIKRMLFFNTTVSPNTCTWDWSLDISLQNLNKKKYLHIANVEWDYNTNRYKGRILLTDKANALLELINPKP